MNKLFLYLARRDKKGMELLASFSKNIKCPPTRVKNIKDLTLPSNLEAEITKIVYEKRMLWELWIESSEDYKTLCNSLTKRGYKNVSHSAVPNKRIDKKDSNPSLRPNIIKKIKTMLRKN
jgi:hypothetical protein